MGKTVRSRKLDLIFVLVVFCVFAASVLVVLMLSGLIYKGISERIQQSYDDRTSLSYIWSKVKNGEDANKIYVGTLQDVSVLCIEEEHDAVQYLTMIYLYDGWIRELVSEKGLVFSPEDGMPVLEADSLSFSQQENGLIKVTANARDLYIYPRVQFAGHSFDLESLPSSLILPVSE